jgi:hypothetical protein
MTAQQPKEHQDPCKYCRQKQQACAYWIDGQKQDDACMDKLWYIKWTARTRPHTPSPALILQEPCWYRDHNVCPHVHPSKHPTILKEHDATIARAATLATLDKFGKEIDAKMMSAGDCQYSDEPVVTVAALVKIEESLRTAAQEDKR